MTDIELERLQLQPQQQLPLPVSNNQNKKHNIFLSFFSGSFASYLFVFLVFLAVFAVMGFKHTLPTFNSTRIMEPCCDSLLTSGYWHSFKSDSSWQPLGCSMTRYTLTMLDQCTEKQKLIFIGDSNARELWNAAGSFSALQKIDRHSNARWIVNGKPRISFVWDPFMNKTSWNLDNNGTDTILVFSFGPWFMKHYMNPNEGLEAFVHAYERVLSLISVYRSIRIYVSPVLPLDEDKLAKGRLSLSNTLANQYNERLEKLLEAHRDDARVRYANIYKDLFSQSVVGSLDGIHYDMNSYQAASNLIINHVCNRQLFSHMGDIKATCCVDYPLLSWKQIIFLVLFLIVGPFTFCIHKFDGRFHNRLPRAITDCLIPETMSKNFTLFGLLLYFLFIADRTHLFLKEQKFFNPLVFAMLISLSFLLGLLTMQKDKDSSFLNRNLSDEWKGWMQVFILIYHYTGASSVSPIYNFARVLVASYLFMTGYGHFIFFYRKKDFGMTRIVKVLIRLNLLAVSLSYVMQTSYQSYYFSPLVSLWFLVIYCVMAIGKSLNQQPTIILGKFIILISIVSMFAFNLKLFQLCVLVLNFIPGTVLNVEEMHFRIFLDMYIVIIGMLTAYIYLTFQSQIDRFLDKKEGFLFWFVAAIASSMQMWYLLFESSKNKFDYNKFHPYTSWIPIISFIYLRNLTPTLRKSTSAFYVFMGKISLETFILQFHIWLAMDTRGLLFIFPDYPVLNFIMASFMFIFSSLKLSQITEIITEYLSTKMLESKAYTMLGLYALISVINHIK